MNNVISMFGRSAVAVLVAVCTVMAAGTADAKAPRRHDKTIEVGGFVGYQIISGDSELGNAFFDENIPTSGLAFGLRGGYNLTGMLGFEGEVKMVSSSFESDGSSASLLGLRALALAHINLMDGRLRPFGAIGYGNEYLMTEKEFDKVSPVSNKNDFAETDSDAALQLGVGVKYFVTNNLLLRLDIRYLNVAGRADLTTHDFEFLFGASYVIDTAVRDADGDGLLDTEDKCPKKPEDKDGFQDKDGCPDPDNDGDGVLDTDDKCPNKAEDKDGWKDADGCPEFDNDNDGLPDGKDKCPNRPEDKDGFKDADGCPDPDNDGDRILDKKDKCPNEAGPASEQGCPIKDADKDGIPDKKDKCPNKPESFNGYKDDDGCPDKKSLVVVTKNEIKILQKVFFEVNKADIKDKSYTLLDTVAVVLGKFPSITKIQVEGHTDDTGADAANMKLSAARAEAVKTYLVGKGLGASRLVAKGYGETAPLCEDAPTLSKKRGRKAKRALKKCRETNRRVQFKIVEVNGKPTGGGDSVTIETKKVIRAK
ncbi:MAG: OmpA family protein [Myxococcales bacterium]|nr:OmpA family protein [Myxococcales bacterium]